MTLQFGRQLSVVVASSSEAIEFAQFRCTFQVRRGDIQTPNSMDLRIYNLSTTTAKKIAGKEFTTVTVKAGYSGNIAQIFSGSIKQARTGRADQRDTYVDLTAADGDGAYNFATISASLQNSTPGSIASQILSAMSIKGVKQGSQPTFSTTQATRGVVLWGSAKDEARLLADDTQCHWSLQDNALSFIPVTQYLAGDPLEISPTTGLVGIPEQTANGIEMRVLLNPSIKIGTAIKLTGTVNLLRFGLDNSSVLTRSLTQGQVQTNADGLYYVMTANHNGDSRGESWYTDLVCLSANATVADVEVTNKLFSAPDAVPRI